jgi:hypothetical protein
METNEAPVARRSRIVNLSFHAAVWVSCLVLAALAPAIVRAYAAYLERRTRANADALVSRVLLNGSAPHREEQAEEASRAETAT